MSCQVLNQLRHPNIITLHGAFDTPKTIVVALEYASAGDLAVYLKAKREDAQNYISATKQSMMPTLQTMLDRFVFDRFGLVFSI